MSKNNFVDAVRANLERSERERGVLLDSMQKIADAAQAEARSHLTADESKRFDEDEARLQLVDEQIASLKERDAELSEVIQRRGTAALSPVGHEFNRQRSLGDDARSVAVRNIENERRFPDCVRSAAVDVIEGAGNGPIATIAATLSDPDYTTAWLKVIREPQRGHLEWSPREQAAFSKSLDLQRAMSVGVNASGGYAVPFVLDPSIVITGTGSINPMRKLATVKRVPAGNWHGVTAAQVTAAWSAEATAVADSSPTLVQPSIPAYLGRAFLPASFEAVVDIADLANEVMVLFADAKDNLEAIAHTTSNGTAAPKGAVFAVGAVAGSRVAPTVGGAIALADAFALQSALPARHSKKATFGSSITVINKLRQLAMAQNSANSVWTDSAQAEGANFLGRGYEEFSAMSASITTGQDVLLYGNFEKYYITDVVGSPTLEYMPNLFDTATGRPTSQRGFMLWWREGGDVVDSDAFRILRL